MQKGVRSGRRGHYGKLIQLGGQLPDLSCGGARGGPCLDILLQRVGGDVAEIGENRAQQRRWAAFGDGADVGATAFESRFLIARLRLP